LRIFLHRIYIFPFVTLPSSFVFFLISPSSLARFLLFSSFLFFDLYASFLVTPPSLSPRCRCPMGRFVISGTFEGILVKVIPGTNKHSRGQIELTKEEYADPAHQEFSNGLQVVALGLTSLVPWPPSFQVRARLGSQPPFATTIDHRLEKKEFAFLRRLSTRCSDFQLSALLQGQWVWCAFRVIHWKNEMPVIKKHDAASQIPASQGWIIRFYRLDGDPNSTSILPSSGRHVRAINDSRTI